MASCHMSTPASSVPTTFPSLNVPPRTRPSTNPSASVRKIASSGLRLRDAMTCAITWFSYLILPTHRDVACDHRMGKSWRWNYINLYASFRLVLGIVHLGNSRRLFTVLRQPSHG